MYLYRMNMIKSRLIDIDPWIDHKEDQCHSLLIGQCRSFAVAQEGRFLENRVLTRISNQEEFPRAKCGKESVACMIFSREPGTTWTYFSFKPASSALVSLTVSHVDEKIAE